MKQYFVKDLDKMKTLASCLRSFALSCLPLSFPLDFNFLLLHSKKQKKVNILWGEVKFLTGSKVCEERKLPFPNRRNSDTDGIVRMEKEV